MLEWKTACKRWGPIRCWILLAQAELEDAAMSNHHDHHEVLEQEHGKHDPGPYWRRAHRDWRFWVGVVLMSAAIAIYVMTIDLAAVPRH